MLKINNSINQKATPPPLQIADVVCRCQTPDFCGELQIFTAKVANRIPATVCWPAGALWEDALLIFERVSLPPVLEGYC